MYKKIINLTFLPVFENKTALMKALLIPLILIIILTKLSLFFTGNTALILLNLPILLLNISIAITTHRILLLGPNSIPTWGSFSLGKREWSFFLMSIVLTVIMIPFGLVVALVLSIKLPTAITMGAIVLMGIFALMCFCRFCLVLPSIAIDNRLSLGESWRYTKNYKMLTFFTIIIFPLVFSLIVGLVYMLVIGFLIALISPHLDILIPVLNVFITVFIISAISATFKVISEEDSQSHKNTPNVLEKIQHNDEEENMKYYSSKKENTETELPSNIRQKTICKKEHNISFEMLQDELLRQYESLGFTQVVSEEVNSCMIKDPKNMNAYIALSLKDDTYTIEVYNIKEPNLNKFLGEKKEEE